MIVQYMKPPPPNPFDEPDTVARHVCTLETDGEVVFMDLKESLRGAAAGGHAVMDVAPTETWPALTASEALA